MSRITFRTNEDLKDEFKQHCESEGKTMSEALEAVVKELVGHTSKGRLPDDPQLAKAYETVFWAAGGNPVEVDDAEAMVSNKLNMPKSAVRGRIMQPLKERGYLTLRQGIGKVRYRPNVDLVDDIVSDPSDGEKEATA